MEKVLRMKRDQHTQIDFLEEVMKTLDDKPSFMFWTTTAKAFEAQTKEAAKCESGDASEPVSNALSLTLDAAGPKFGIPPTSEIVSRLLRQNRRTYRYSLHS